MNHQQALEIQAVDKYLLNELSPAEREEFEEHFFVCAECAAELRAAAVFAANARAVFAEEADRAAAGSPRWAGWVGALRRPRPAWALALLAALAVMAGYEFIRVPALKRELGITSPQPYPAFLLTSVARGGGPVLAVPASARFVGLSLDLPPGAAHLEYEYRLLTAAGQAAFSITSPAPTAPASTFNLLVPTASLRSGRQTLLLMGLGDGAPEEIDRYDFILQIE